MIKMIKSKHSFIDASRSMTSEDKRDRLFVNIIQDIIFIM